MIEMDIRMPERCGDCPCSYWIRTGEHEEECMCEAMEYQGMDAEETIVDERRRPDICPMKEKRK